MLIEILGQNGSLEASIGNWAEHRNIRIHLCSDLAAGPGGDAVIWIADPNDATIPRELAPWISTRPGLACVPHISAPLARRAIDAGFTDIIFIPTSERVLHSALELLMNSSGRIKPADTAVAIPIKTSVSTLESSPRGKALLEEAARIATMPANVTLTGEQGVEFEAVARMVHESSHRARGPFARIDGNRQVLSMDISDTCIRASTGTLYVHRVDRLSEEAQRSLSFKLIARRAPVTDRSAWRLIASTTMDLDALAKSGKFDRTLADQLSVVVLKIPSIRQRKENFVKLCSAILDDLAASLHVSGKRLTPEALARLDSYSWPFNFDELRATLETGMSRSPGDEIGPDALPPLGDPSQLDRTLWLIRGGRNPQDDSLPD